MSETESLKILIEAIQRHERENPEHDPIDLELYGALELATARFADYELCQ